MDETEDSPASCQIEIWKKKLFFPVKWKIFHLEENVSGGNKGVFAKNRSKLQNQQFKVLYCMHLGINWNTEVMEWIRWFVLVGIIKIHKV